MHWLAWAVAIAGGGGWLVSRSPADARVTAAGLVVLATAFAALFARSRPRLAMGVAAGATALATIAYDPTRPTAWWLGAGAVLVFGALGLSAASGRAPRATAWCIAAVGFASLAGAAFTMFPAGSWGDVVLADDYGIVHYNTVRDLDACAAGGVFGWEDRVEGGRPMILNLRSLAPLVIPFLGFGREVALHLLYVVALLAFPWLIGGLVHRVARAPGALPWGVALGSAFAWTMTTNLFRFGMMNSFLALDLLLVQLIALDGWMRGRRRDAILLGLAVGLGVWVHVAQLVFGLAVLAMVAVGHWVHGRRPRRPLAAGAVLLAFGAAWPFIAALWRERDAMAAEYLMDVSPVIAALAAAGPLGAIELVLREMIWSFPGYLRVAVAALPLVGLVIGRRRGGVGIAVAVGLLAVAPLLAWIPDLAYAMLRAHFLVAALAAALAAIAIVHTPTELRGIIAVAALGLALAVPGLAWPGEHYHAQGLRASEPDLVAAVASLPGHRVLYENTAGQSPLADLTAAFDAWPGDEVQRAGPLALATGRTLFAHAGWDPYPYHRLRDAFIVNGAWQGRKLPDVDADAFEATMRRYGVGGVAIWSASARAWFDARPERYRPVGTVPARGAPVRTAPFRLYAVVDADARMLRLEPGVGELIERDPFTRRFSVRGAREGATITWVTRFRAGWTATVDGAVAPVVDAGGLVSVVSPRDGDFELCFRYPKRHGDLALGAACALLGVILVGFGGARRE